MATMPSQGGPVSSSLGVTPQGQTETDEERRRRLAQIQFSAQKSAGLVSDALMNTPNGNY